MKELKQLTIAVFAVAISLCAMYLSMTKGWGLEVKNWAWFIGCSFFGQVLAQTVLAIGNAKDKEPNEI